MLRHEAEHPYNPNPNGCSSRGRGHRQNINLLIIVAGGSCFDWGPDWRERLGRMFFVSSPTASGPPQLQGNKGMQHILANAALQYARQADKATRNHRQGWTPHSFRCWHGHVYSNPLGQLVRLVRKNIRLEEATMPSRVLLEKKPSIISLRGDSPKEW